MTEFSNAAGSEEPDGEYGLLYPFVCCESNGGPYEDQAFVAGCRFGEVSALLKEPDRLDYETYIEPDMVAQYDLLAMHEGYALTTEPSSDEWVEAKFVRHSPEKAGGFARDAQ